jgi:DNA polymerase I-like protein with 3'-5' exonuclease and polymerase domains
MRQDEGIGTQVEWHDPAPYVESLLGHKRFFSLENKICKKLFDLANKLPPNWKEIKGKCVRRDREQTMAGAMMSALYAAAFNIQAKNLRAASNHIIQSTGATITKDLQARLWQLQPAGINEWMIQPLNVHDEVMAPIKPELKDKAKEIVDQLIQDYRYLIPLIAIGWNSKMDTWADK